MLYCRKALLIISFVFLAASLLPAGAQNIPTPYNARAQAAPSISATVEYLKESDVEEIIRLLESTRSKRLSINSGGGDLSAARLGRYVFDAEIEVHVSSYCLAACATYIFLPAKKKFLGPKAYVGGFSPGPSWERYASLWPDEGRIAIGEYFKFNQEFFSHTSVPLGVVDALGRLAGFQCYRMRGESGPFFDTRHPLAAPSARLWADLGLAPIANWPENEIDLRERFHRLPLVSALEADVSMRDEPVPAPEPLPRCD